MRTFTKIFIVGVLFSLAVEAHAFGEETKTPEASDTVTVQVTPVTTTVVTATAQASVIISAPAPAMMTPVERTTLDNLQVAFNEESNANARDLAFAKKSEEEGYGKIASLFRATACAHQVLIGSYGKVIKASGGNPVAQIEAPAVKSTADNLKIAFDGETYETNSRDPEFLAKAEKDKIPGAIDIFKEVGKTKGAHAAFYKKAMQDMNAWKGKGKTFYVCPGCGNLVEKTNFKKCPICNISKKLFVAVK